jgi:predicted transcriptional regulator
MKLSHLIRNNYTVVDSYQGTASVKEILLENAFVVVMENSAYKGILTPKDIVKSPYNLIIDCLSEKPHIGPDFVIDDVFRIMKETQNSVLPVFQKDKFLGVICRADIMDFLIEEQWKLEVEIDITKEALFHLNQKLINEIKDRELAEKDVKELQKQVYHSQKMQALGTLASGIVHEFNNYIHIILGRAELTRDALPKESTIRENIEDIINTIFKLENILKQLSSFSYKTKPSCKILDPVAIIQESIKLIKNVLPRNIDTRFIPSGKPAYDRSRSVTDTADTDQFVRECCLCDERCNRFYRY